MQAFLSSTELAIREMSTSPVPKVRIAPPARTASRPYACLSLVELIELIVTRRNRRALWELQHRTVFFYQDSTPLPLTELVERLREEPAAARAVGGRTEILDGARDLTLDKFGNLPRAPRKSKRRSARPKPRQSAGPDCRRYFAPFLDYMKRLQREQPLVSQLRDEDLAARRLQALVRWHFRQSCWECARRQDVLARRYAWKVAGRTLRITMPISLAGRACGVWLQTHIPDADPTRPGERERIQIVVDQHFGRRHLVRLESADAERQCRTVSPPPVIWEAADTGFAQRLATVVAEEKVTTIKQQRPAIRRLGPTKLRRLIRRIFNDLKHGRYRDGALARAFGLSPASLSRFAGSRWSRPKRSKKGKPSIPDLWRNTAHLLAFHPAFADAARSAGVWKEVNNIVDQDEPRRRSL